MKKKIIIFTILIVIILVALIITYNRQEHIILSKKFCIPIKKEVDIIYLDNQEKFGVDNPYCKAVIFIDENEYIKLVGSMEKADYYKSTVEEHDNMLKNNSYWIPGEEITEVYEMHTVEYVFVAGRRIHIRVFITEAKDGYRKVYLSKT